MCQIENATRPSDTLNLKESVCVGQPVREATRDGVEELRQALHAYRCSPLLGQVAKGLYRLALFR